MEQSPKMYFSPENRVAPLGIVALEGAEELAQKIEAHLVRWAKRADMDVETFRIGEAFGRRRMPDVRWNTFVKDTGDADMIRVPHRACVQIETEGDGHDRAMALLLEIAMGAAIMHQCQLRVVSAQ